MRLVPRFQYVLAMLLLGTTAVTWWATRGPVPITAEDAEAKAQPRLMKEGSPGLSPSDPIPVMEPGEQHEAYATTRWFGDERIETLREAPQRPPGPVIPTIKDSTGRLLVTDEAN